MIGLATSVNGVPVRLTAERWRHIILARDDLEEREDEVLGAVERPDWITRGYHGSLLAWKAYGRKGFLVVVYRELSPEDGFIITAYFARSPKKGNKTWPR